MRARLSAIHSLNWLTPVFSNNTHLILTRMFYCYFLGHFYIIFFPTSLVWLGCFCCVVLCPLLWSDMRARRNEQRTILIFIIYYYMATGGICFNLRFFLFWLLRERDWVFLLLFFFKPPLAMKMTKCRENFKFVTILVTFWRTRQKMKEKTFEARQVIFYAFFWGLFK